MKYLKRQKEKTWVEIDTIAIEENYKTFRSLIPKKTRLMAVVKSNAYGHDLIQFSRKMDALGVDYFGVDSIEEALELRKNKIEKPILVLGYVPDSFFNKVSKNNISITVSNFEAFKKAEKFKNKLQVHLEVDTGLGRQGFLPSDIRNVLKYLKNTKNIILEGLYTHFAGIESEEFGYYTKKQMNEYLKWKEVLLKEGFNPICHTAPSAGALLFKDISLDMVRVGISNYGLWPSEEIEKIAEWRKVKLKPILSWKTVISEIKKMPKGSKIGYDLTEELKFDSTIAIIPIGYWHGYKRSLSSKGEVLVGGSIAKVLGRVSMNMTVIDISAIKNVKVGDEVILIGKSGRSNIKAQDVALKAGTINYEFVTNINPEISRIYL